MYLLTILNINLSQGLREMYTFKISFYKQFVICFLHDYFGEVSLFLNVKASLKLKSSVLL